MLRVEYILDLLPFEDGSLGLVLELQVFVLEPVDGVSKTVVFFFEGFSSRQL